MARVMLLILESIGSSIYMGQDRLHRRMVRELPYRTGWKQFMSNPEIAAMLQLNQTTSQTTSVRFDIQV